jgi:DNA-binding XRE family transcriptional regulator
MGRREPSMMSKLLRAVREDCELTQSDLAALANVSRRSITRWEADDARPSLKQGAQLVRAILEIDRDVALHLADAVGVPRAAIPDAPLPATPPLEAMRQPEPVVPPPVDPRARDSQMLQAIVAGADSIDVSAKRLCAALAITVQHWVVAGFSVDEIAAYLASKIAH